MGGRPGKGSWPRALPLPLPLFLVLVICANEAYVCVGHTTTSLAPSPGQLPAFARAVQCVKLTCSGASRGERQHASGQHCLCPSCWVPSCYLVHTRKFSLCFHGGWQHFSQASAHCRSCKIPVGQVAFPVSSYSSVTSYLVLTLVVPCPGECQCLEEEKIWRN